MATVLGTRFLVRTCVNRLSDDGTRTVLEQMRRSPARGVHRIKIQTQEGEVREVELQLKYERLSVRPPLGKQDDYPPLALTVIHATEQRPPKNRSKIE